MNLNGMVAELNHDNKKYLKKTPVNKLNAQKEHILKIFAAKNLNFEPRATLAGFTVDKTVETKLQIKIFWKFPNIKTIRCAITLNGYKKEIAHKYF